MIHSGYIYNGYIVDIVYYPVANVGSDKKSSGYSMSQQKMRSDLELPLEFPNHIYYFLRQIWGSQRETEETWEPVSYVED